MISRRSFVAFVTVSPFAGLTGRAAAAADNAPIELPVNFIGTRVAVALTIKNQTLNFMLDTGAFASLIEKDFVKVLGLVPSGQTRFNGRMLPLFAAHNVLFANTFRQGELLFAELEGKGLGDGIAGTLSAGVITDHDSDLDFGQGRWRIYPKGRPELPAGFVELDSEIVKGRTGVGSAYIFVEGTLGGKRYRFLVDTGAPGAISLFNAAAKNSIFARSNLPYAPARTANTNGVGNVSPLIRGDALDLGNGIRFERPLVLLDQNPSWHLENADGVIGLGLLRQLNFATDLGKEKLWVKRNRIPERPQSYARSGLWIDRAKSGVIISEVGTGSPAAQAGLEAGDLLPDLDFTSALKTINQPAGTTITLDVERKGKREQIKLVLAEYL